VRDCLRSLSSLIPSKTTQLQKANFPEKLAGQKHISIHVIDDYSQPRKLKVGLAWAGRPDNALDYRRTCPFTDLLPLFGFKDISFYSLQIGNNRSAETAATPLIDLTGDICDFEDTAALIMNLDLVISIDTSIAHISGALGKETWVLLPYSAEWRWLQQRSDSPWYPTIKLFRQPEHGDWPSVIRKVCENLAELSHAQIPTTCLPDGTTKPFLSTERRALEVSLEAYRQKLANSPNSPEALLDVAAALALLGRNNEAISLLRAALARKPDHIGAHLNLAYTLLSQGNYVEGWDHYEWRRYRIQPSELPPWPFLEQSMLGKQSQGTSLLVHCEQGFGDTIQFARFLPLLVNAGYHVTVSCQPLLVNLIAQVNSKLHVVGYGEILPECNVQTLLLSLPYLFKMTVESIPATTPYLLPRLEKINQWHQRLLPGNNPIKLTWS
jgi:tetratricopeptide (TPR) repeat protein